MFPLISVCIPVFNTESFLLQCLQSVMTQDFPDFEVIVVSDSSCGKDEKGRSAKKIVRLAQKINKKIPLRFIENNENRGILETRRTLCLEAKSQYICYVDSDDQLEEGALSALVSPMSLSGLTGQSYDIIQAQSTAGTYEENGTFIPAVQKRYNSITIGQLHDNQMFHEWVSDGNISGVLWSKLIRRELLLQAFENIPYSECNFAEDYLISFFIYQYAKSYIGIDKKAYRYRISSGISSNRKIDNLRKWEMVCSTSSVFAIIALWLKDHPDSPITEEEKECIKRKTSLYLANNLQQLKETVIPELQPQAYQLLCEYWGEDFVNKIQTLVQ
ncbi:MAG: glycosyltransferase [Treponemataceae bacterium]|nr:glycosyltransferase [Treponemataceae bacterium]